MPAIGLGTFGSDHVSAEEVANAVRGAARVGYRHFDCAAVYGNEDRIGFALRDIIASGIPRGELWVTSKLWNDSHSAEAVIPTCGKPWPTCSSIISIYTWCTGPFPITTLPAAT